MPTAKNKSQAQKPPGVAALIVDPAAPAEMRLELLRAVLHQDGPEAAAVREHLLAVLASATAEDRFRQRTAELEKKLAALEAGPLRAATFRRTVSLNGGGPRAEVILEDGQTALCAVLDDALLERLRTGDAVYLEAQARAVLHAERRSVDVGEEALLERRVDDARVEVSLRGEERLVMLAAATLREQLDSGVAAPGLRVIVTPQMRMAWEAVPPGDGFEHFQHLDRAPIPDVRIERDLGLPPPYLQELRDHVDVAMREPERLARYGVRRAIMALLEGPPGTGKTLSIAAFTRALYEDVAAITGIPLGELPPLVMRIRVGAVLSEWLGRSDKNLERVFDEAEQLAAEELVGPDGRAWPRPVLIVFEEVESLARTRGSDHEAVYDRIQTTLLQRLDPGAGTLADRLLIVIGTTNVGNLVDRAFVRRIGGVVERFQHLDRRGCAAVLEKHLGRRPVAAERGEEPAAARARLAADLVAWLFGPNAGDRGQAELSIAGRTQPRMLHRRDFLTGGLIDRAMQAASREALQLEIAGEGEGLTRAMLARAIDEQVRAIVERLDERCVRQYVPLEDGVHVTGVRRLPQPAQLAVELDRTA